MSEQAVIYLRVPADMKDALQAWAELEDRPLNMHVLRLLRGVLDDALRNGEPDVKRLMQGLRQEQR